MKGMFRILALVKDYKGRITSYTVLTALSSVFGVVSITMAIPFLNIIFDRGDKNSDFSDYSGGADGVFRRMTEFIQHVKAQQGQETALLYVSACLVFLFFLKNLTRYFALNVLTPVRTGVIFTLRERIYTKINRLSMEFFTDRRKGDVLTRMSSDVAEVEWTIMNSLTSLIREPLMIVNTLIFMLFISVKLTLIIFLVLPVSGVIIGRIASA